MVHSFFYSIFIFQVKEFLDAMADAEQMIDVSSGAEADLSSEVLY